MFNTNSQQNVDGGFFYGDIPLKIHTESFRSRLYPTLLSYKIKRPVYLLPEHYVSKKTLDHAYLDQFPFLVICPVLVRNSLSFTPGYCF